MEIQYSKIAQIKPQLLTYCHGFEINMNIIHSNSDWLNLKPEIWNRHPHLSKHK